jgi:hypothetical protein
LFVVRSPVSETAEVTLAGVNDAEGVKALAMPMTDMATAAFTAPLLPIWRGCVEGYLWGFLRYTAAASSSSIFLCPAGDRSSGLVPCVSVAQRNVAGQCEREEDIEVGVIIVLHGARCGQVQGKVQRSRTGETLGESSSMCWPRGAEPWYANRWCHLGASSHIGGAVHRFTDGGEWVPQARVSCAGWLGKKN